MTNTTKRSQGTDLMTKMTTMEASRNLTPGYRTQRFRAGVFS